MVSERYASRTYLVSSLQKTVFAEHAVDEDDGRKGKKKDWESVKKKCIAQFQSQ